MRIIYVSGGQANIIDAHLNWRAGIDDPSQMSITFSSQVAEAVERIHADALFVSFTEENKQQVDGRFKLSHIKGYRFDGVKYYIEEVRRTFIVLGRAFRFRASVAVVDSGAIPYFLLPAFRLMGMSVVPILHNMLWPAGYPPSSFKGKSVLALDRLFWRLLRAPTLSVSPEGVRQVAAMQGGSRSPVVHFIPLFRRSFFVAIPPPPAHTEPFRIMFVGRAVRNKGLLMLPDIAAAVEARRPDRVRWVVCGDGPDLQELRDVVAQRGLEMLFEIRGWTSPAELRHIYSMIHAVIVPTTSGFNEGLAMTAVEAVLAGRPVISNPVVPALELLEPAAVSAVTDDASSHAEAALRLADNASLYEQKRAACPILAEQFYSAERGLRSALVRAFDMLKRPRKGRS